MRPEDKSTEDNQMSPKGQKGVGSYTEEDKSGIPSKIGPNPDEKGATNAPNTDSVAINKSRGTGMQVNNGAMEADQASPYGEGSASAIAKVTKVTGESVPGMNSGPSIGRFDNPPAVMTRTGTDESVEDACDAIEDRWPGTDTEQVGGETKYSSKNGADRFWR